MMSDAYELVNTLRGVKQRIGRDMVGRPRSSAFDSKAKGTGGVANQYVATIMTVAGHQANVEWLLWTALMQPTTTDPDPSR